MGEQYWSFDHPVLQVLRVRRSRQDSPSNRRDPYKVGLAVQGGGMRGVVSAGMLTALDDLGLGHAFDAIYASSSGAINGAYFLMGDAWRRLRIYWDYLTTPRFIDLRRFFGGNILDLEYLFKTVMEQLEPLDYSVVLLSDVALHIAITLIDELRTITVSDFTSAEEVTDALRASAWLPIAIRGTTPFRGQRAIDGTILAVHPHRFALRDGCTHVLSLTTRPSGPFKVTFAPQRLVMRRELKRIHPGLSKRYAIAGQDYRKDRVSLAAWSRWPSDQPYVLDIAPLSWMNEIKPFETDAGRLIVAARQAYDLMTCAVEKKNPAELPINGVRTAIRFTPVARDDNSTGSARHCDERS